ncbi:MAG TPA: YggT family protein [Burkholderiaceae bacterium]|nr:YggT family protein [Burkholderiaceae bacterium]
MRALWLVIETLGSLLSIACVLRAYAHRIHLNPRNPISVFLAALTDWLVRPLRRLIPASPAMDWASVLAALLVAMVTATLFYLIVGGVQVPNAGAVLFVACLWLIRWTLWLVMGIVIVYAILSWVNPYAPLAPALSQLASPLLAPFRRFVPLIGGVDLSPLVLIIVVQVLLMLINPVSLPMMLR